MRISHDTSPHEGAGTRKLAGQGCGAALCQETSGHLLDPCKVNREQLFICLVPARSLSSCVKSGNTFRPFSRVFLSTEARCLSHNHPLPMYPVFSFPLCLPSLVIH